MKSLFLDHIVLIVKDINETEKFYSTFFSYPEHQSEDSLSYKVGETKIFFSTTYKEWVTPDKDSGGINHIAFGVRSLDDLKECESKLNQAGIVNSGIQVDKYGNKEFVWFDDPNGYRLEFYCRPEQI